MRRRSFLAQVAAVIATIPLVGSLIPLSARAQAAQPRKLKIMMKSAWGSDDPTKAAFPFLHGLALAEAGHEVQIFLLGEAVSLMRASLAAAVVPVGWPPLAGTLDKVKARGIQIYACGACSRARGITEADLMPHSAKFGSPVIFVGLVEWADRVITE